MLTVSNIRPARNSRAVLIGTTGCGKTTLAREFLNPAYFRFVAIYDAKGLIRWNGYKRYTKLERLIREDRERVIYAPTAAQLRSSDHIQAFFNWVYLRGNTALYVDEATSVTSRDWIPPGYHDCIHRGREKGITTLTATQRPIQVPQSILSESEYVYVFRLRMEQDRKKVERTYGIEQELVEVLPKQEFYFSTDDGTRGPLKLQL